MLMIRSDILLLSDEEVLASLYAYNKRKTLIDGKNLKQTFMLRVDTKMNGLTRYYSVLGLTPSAGIDMIRSKYRQLAKKFHPDTFTGSRDVSQRVMCDLNEAMESCPRHTRSPLPNQNR